MKEFEYFIIEICRKKWKNLNNIGGKGIWISIID